MIPITTSIENMEIALRQVLMAQSELDGKYVLNAIQLKGPAMHSNTGTNGQMIFQSFSPFDSVIVFELRENDDGQNMSEAIDVSGVEKQFVFAQYELKLIIYGNNSAMLAQKLKARLFSTEVRDTLFVAGIHLQTITRIEQASEFINNVLWQRRDMSIEFACCFEIQNIATYTTTSNTSGMEIIVAK